MNTLSGFVVIGIACLLTTQTASGQEGPSSPIPTGQPASRLNLTFEDALNRARANSTEFQAAVTNLGLAVEDTGNGRLGLLP